MTEIVLTTMLSVDELDQVITNTDWNASIDRAIQQFRNMMRQEIKSSQDNIEYIKHTD